MHVKDKETNYISEIQGGANMRAYEQPVRPFVRFQTIIENIKRAYTDLLEK